MADLIEDSEVINFYKDGHILITGATGFMGKVVIDKFLRVCRNVGQLYFLVRVKKGKDPSSRLKDLFEDPVFSRLKKEVPNYLQKITVIPGDCSLPGLGLSDEHKILLSGVLTHIFHGAATVRFDEKIKQAITVNVQGVKEMLLFCHSCKNLKSILHTSTAYSNCPLESIKEQFYDPPMTGDNALKLVESLTDDKLDIITPELIKPWPNTYSFSKAIAEDIVQKYGKGLPIGVFRPSIIISSVAEPVPGWIDNFYGPTGAVAGAGAGLLRVLYADADLVADLVPVDMAVNSLLCAAKEVAEKFQKAERTADLDGEKQPEQNDIPIYQYVASKNNSISWKDFMHLNLRYGSKIPSIRAIWYYTITITKYWPVYRFLAVLYHLLPALLMDSVLYLTGNKTMLWKAYEKIHKFSIVISFFSSKQWNFENENTMKLWNNLSPTDQKLFQFDMNSVDWEEFFKNSVNGIRLYLFNESVSTLPAARRRLFLFYLAHRFLQCILFGIAAWLMFTTLNYFYPFQPFFSSEIAPIFQRFKVD